MKTSDLTGPVLYHWTACALGLPVVGFRASSVVIGPDYFEFAPQGSERGMRALVRAVYGDTVADEPSNETLRQCDNDSEAYWRYVDAESRTVIKLPITERDFKRDPIGSYSGADLFRR